MKIERDFKEIQKSVRFPFEDKAPIDRDSHSRLFELVPRDKHGSGGARSMESYILEPKVP